jgi:hypothetical protein
MITRLWGIRHLRYAYLKCRLLLWWGTYTGPGLFINDADWDYLEAVWNGTM